MSRSDFCRVSSEYELGSTSPVGETAWGESSEEKQLEDEDGGEGGPLYVAVLICPVLSGDVGLADKQSKDDEDEEDEEDDSDVLDEKTEEGSLLL